MGYSHYRFARRVDANACKIVNEQNLDIVKFELASGTDDAIISNAGTTVTDDLYLRANASAVTTPSIYLLGSDVMRFYLHSNAALDIYNSSTLEFKLLQAAIHFKEISGAAPTPVADFGAIYTKNDNKLYFQDGAGNSHEVDFV